MEEDLCEVCGEKKSEEKSLEDALGRDYFFCQECLEKCVCSVCGKEFSPEEGDYVMITDEGHVACSDCAEKFELCVGCRCVVNLEEDGYRQTEDGVVCDSCQEQLAYQGYEG